MNQCLSISFTRTTLNSIVLAVLLIPLMVQSLSGQGKTESKIFGSVIDSETGEVLIGANVFLEGTTIGAVTDIEGHYTIRNVPPGTYTLIVSLVSYTRKQITNVLIEPNKPIQLDLILTPDAVKMQTVEVEGKAILSYEGALLTKQKKATGISDGISSEQIKRTPDATSSDALRRITGISVVDNKFVYIRGTSERYSLTRVNGATLASTEPDKRSFAFDLFPSNLIDNMIIAKTFTPDVPGDFSGGLVDMNTIDFPSDLTFRVNISPSVNAQTTGRGFATYAGGSTDAFGMDDGTRSLPSGLPSDLNAQNYSSAELQSFGRMFNNVWAPTAKKAPMNGSYQISLGDGVTLLGNNFGFVASFSYRNSFNISEIERNDYELAGPKFTYAGRQNTFSVLWGGIFNFSYKLTDNHKFSIKNFFNRSSDDDVVELSGIDHLSFFDTRTTMLRYISRSVFSSTLGGEHYFPEFGQMQLQWKATYSLGKRDEPDYRRISFVRDVGTEDPYRILINFQPDPKNGGRFYSLLDDRSTNFSTDITLPIMSIKMKFGGLLDRKVRDFNSRLVGYIASIQTNPALYYLDIRSIFLPENISQSGFRISEYSSGTNRYDAEQDLLAGYVMGDVPFSLGSEKMRIVAGARVEYSRQQLHSMNFANTLPIESDLKNVDLLPSLNFTYFLSDASNIRLAVSKTVNRPEFRELAPFAYYDFGTGTTVYGNPKLQRASIMNYDLRAETFPNPGEILSASIFFKDFTQAIEQVVVPGNSLGAERTFMNAEKAHNYGFEAEMRKSLDILLSSLADLSLTANYTRVYSKVDVKGSAFGYARNDRPLQGQAPYAINVGLNYSNADIGTVLSVMYNRNGARIVEVATIYNEDVIEVPRDLLDVTLTQYLTKNFEIKLSAKDIFGNKQLFEQGGKIARSNSKTSNYSVGVSFKL